ncbi:MAG TPA: hypothetical protein VFF65_05085 [Phycisphaerales bacterium]|nr:hypothetical protein [Phycisphaerales bacterium]
MTPLSSDTLSAGKPASSHFTEKRLTTHAATDTTSTTPAAHMTVRRSRLVRASFMAGAPSHTPGTGR